MYSIGEVAKYKNLSVPTLRYYDQEGLLIDIKRDNGGKRIFDDKDLEALTLIECLKNSGLKLKEIKEFMNLCRLGDSTLDERYKFFINQEANIHKEIERLNKTLALIKFKEWYYETAIVNSSEDSVKNMKLDSMPSDIKELYLKV